MFEVTIEETFAAGHALRNYRGKCENVHGHNYRCQVTLEGAELDSIGLLVDFVALKKVVHGVLVLLDNRITKQRYGQVFFDSLPDYGFTTRIQDVEKFFDV